MIITLYSESLQSDLNRQERYDFLRKFMRQFRGKGIAVMTGAFTNAISDNGC